MTERKDKKSNGKWQNGNAKCKMQKERMKKLKLKYILDDDDGVCLGYKWRWRWCLNDCFGWVSWLNRRLNDWTDGWIEAQVPQYDGFLILITQNSWTCSKVEICAICKLICFLQNIFMRELCTRQGLLFLQSYCSFIFYLYTLTHTQYIYIHTYISHIKNMINPQKSNK